MCEPSRSLRSSSKFESALLTAWPPNNSTYEPHAGETRIRQPPRATAKEGTDQYCVTTPCPVLPGPLPFLTLHRHNAFLSGYISDSTSMFRDTTVIAMIYWSALLLLLPLVSASPLERSAKTACGQFDTITSGSYSLLTNHWGASAATSGSQCSTLGSVNGNTVEWSTEWTWSCETCIKSFSNIQLNTGINQQLSAISSMHVRIAAHIVFCIFPLRSVS